MPNYYNDDNVLLRFSATVNGATEIPSSAVIDIYDPVAALRVDGASATIDGTTGEISYLVAGSVNDKVGTYKYQCTVTFTGGLGLLSVQGTYRMLAKF
jgi:hypothetical protein